MISVSVSYVDWKAHRYLGPTYLTKLHACVVADEAAWNGDSCVSGWGRATGGCLYANAVADPAKVAVVSRN